ncbi:MAG: hypothetical protein PHO20_05730, partial [Candidatus Peribacteraceae bacterium]|nr:hypothetical protein [Candidatus Peribacteraceae bacterium]
FVPFIWMSNWLFTTSFQLLRSSVPAVIAIAAGALIKTLFLALSTFLLRTFDLVPELFLTSMSLIQFFTALAGGVLAIAIVRFLRNKHE